MNLAQYATAFKQLTSGVYTAGAFDAFGNIHDCIGGSWFNVGPNGTGPGANPGNTANGVVPTNTTAGALSIVPFGVGDTGYLTRLRFIPQWTNAGRIWLWDRLWHAGGYTSAMGTVTLTSQPSFSSRLPGGTDYTGLQLYAEQPPASGLSGGIITVTYTNESGVAGHSTGAVSVNNRNTGQMWRMPLQAGDCGIQKIESVTITGTANPVNIVICRLLRQFAAVVPNNDGLFPCDEVTFGIDYRPLQIFQDSCFFWGGIVPANAEGYAELEITSGAF